MRAGLVSAGDIPPNRRRGGDVRTLLSPRTVGSTSGFMGVVRLSAGERVAEHYHPYSEEFMYVVDGALEVDLDDVPHPMRAGDAVFVPVNLRHRLRNIGDGEAFVVFHLGPLAPRPELGHVDTETADGTPITAEEPAR